MVSEEFKKGFNWTCGIVFALCFMCLGAAAIHKIVHWIFY